MRKLLFVFLLCVCLCGCALDDNTSLKDTDLKTEPTKSTDAKIEVVGTPAEFTKWERQYTNEDGYTFKGTLYISQWLKLSKDEETLRATWATVLNKTGSAGYKDIEFPTTYNWSGMKSLGNNEYRIYSNLNNLSVMQSKLNDWYYCIGYIEIENITDGFDLSPKNFGYPVFLVSVTPNKSRTIDKLVYLNASEYYLSTDLQPRMNENKEAFPFILAYAEYNTPNNPNGEYKEDLKKANVYFFGGVNTEGIKINPSVPEY